MTLGLVCDACDALSPINATVCQLCGHSLGVARASSARPAILDQSAPRPPEPQGVAGAAATARNCPSCGAEVAPNHRFCGSCGKPVAAASAAPPPLAARPQAIAAPAALRPGKTMFFGAMQAPSPKLILIKGEGLDGVTYVLSATEHIAGRLEGAILFPEDPLLSPRHANFIYRDGKLIVRDEGSANGVFLRIIKPITVATGSTFLVGEQLLRVEACPPDEVPVPDEEGTYFYGSPKRPSRLALTQLLAGGHEGMVFRARNDSLTIGREANDVNFPDDPFISGRHATVTAIDGPGGTQFQIADLGSKNGTFVRVSGESPLFHGDYVFVGQQLLRVEIT
jgi:pSer/pThr/pTyr-binding forkhead associated (FHA) protein